MVAFVASAASATATPTMPAGVAAGDRVYVVAYRDAANTTLPTVPANWVTVGSRAVAPPLVIAYRDYDGSWTMSGVSFTNATRTVAVAYRPGTGKEFVATHPTPVFGGATSNSISYPAVTLVDATGASAFFRGALHTRPDVVIPTPTNHTLVDATGTNPGYGTFRLTTNPTTNPAAATSAVSRSAAWSSFSLEVAEYTPTPTAPTSRTISASVASPTSVQLSWSDDAAAYPNPTYTIETSTDNVAWTQHATGQTGQTGYLVTGLTTNQLYYFRVIGTNASGSSTSNTVSATPVAWKQTNDMEGGTSGSSISTANSGGTGNTAFNLFYSNTASVFSNAFARGGTLSAQTAHTTGTSGSSMFGWDFSTATKLPIYFRAYLNLGGTALPTADTVIMRIGSSADAVVTDVRLTSTGMLRIGSAGSVTTTAINTTGWTRFEVSVTSTVVTLRIFTTPESATAAQEITQTGTFAAIGTVRFGVNAVTNAGPYYWDDVAVGEETWFGPVGGSVPTHAGDAALTASSVLSSTSAVDMSAAGALTGSSVLSSSGTVTQAAASGLTSSSVLSTSGVRIAAAEAGLSASGVLTSEGGVSKTGAVGLTSSSVLNVPAFVVEEGAASLVSASTFSAGAVHTRLGSVSLNASATVVAEAVRTQLAEAGLSAVSTLDVTGVRVQPTTATLTSSSVLSGSAVRTTWAESSLSSTSTVSISGVTTGFGTLSLVSSSVLSSDALRTTFGDASLTASSVVSVAAFSIRSAAASLATSGILESSASGLSNWPGAVSFTATSVLFSDGTRTTSGGVSLVGSGVLSSSGGTTGFVVASLSTLSTLSAAGVTTLYPQVPLSAVSSLVSASAGVSGSSVLTATSGLNVVAETNRVAGVALQGGVVLIVETTVGHAAAVALQIQHALETTPSVGRVAAVVLTSDVLLSAQLYQGLSASAPLQSLSVLALSANVVVPGDRDPRAFARARPNMTYAVIRENETKAVIHINMTTALMRKTV